MQEVMLWRARFSWKEGIGLPQGPEWAQGFVGGSRTAVVYGLPGNVVRLTTLDTMTQTAALLVARKGAPVMTVAVRATADIRTGAVAGWLLFFSSCNIRLG